MGLGDLFSLNTVYVHIRAFTSQQNISALGTKCLGLSAEVLWCRFGWAPRKPAPLPGLGGSMGLPVAQLAGAARAENVQQVQLPHVSWASCGVSDRVYGFA